MRISDWSSDVCSSDLPYSKLDLSRIIVPGHEYVGEILDYGPGSRRPLKVGSMVTSAPVMRHAGGHSIIGQSHDCPGGFGELMLLDENALMAVPAGLDDDMAAMTEPLAVGLEHARSGEPGKDRKSVVEGKSVSVRVDPGGRRIIKKNKKTK